MGVTYSIGRIVSGGATSFPLLTDGFDYSSHGNKVVGINAGGTALEPKVNSASVAWGGVTGDLSDQTDLQSALNAKQNTITNSDSITEGATNLFLTSAERTKLTNTSGTNTGDQDISGIATNASNISTLSSTKADKSNVLELDNTTPFTPDADYEPATKKYVDDSIVGGGGYTDEQAQDAVGLILSAEFTYDDPTPSISVNSISADKITDGSTNKAYTGTEQTKLAGIEALADVTDLTNVLAALNTIGSVAEGDILYRNASSWVRLARGTDGQVLKSTASSIAWGTDNSGGGGAETWQTATQANGAGSIDLSTNSWCHITATTDVNTTQISTSDIPTGKICLLKYTASGSNITLTNGLTSNDNFGGSILITTSESLLVQLLKDNNGAIELRASIGTAP